MNDPIWVRKLKLGFRQEASVENLRAVAREKRQQHNKGLT